MWFWVLMFSGRCHLIFGWFAILVFERCFDAFERGVERIWDPHLPKTVRSVGSTGLAQCVYVKHSFGRVGGWCSGLVGLLLLWFLFTFGILQFGVSTVQVCGNSILMFLDWCHCSGCCREGWPISLGSLEWVCCGGSEGSFISVWNLLPRFILTWRGSGCNMWFWTVNHLKCFAVLSFHLVAVVVQTWLETECLLSSSVGNSLLWCHSWDFTLLEDVNSIFRRDLDCQGIFR